MSDSREMSYQYPMVTIYDRASDRHEPPMVFPALDVAIRRFTDMVNTEGSIYNSHPEDFVLRDAGLWDSRLGQPCGEPRGVQITTAAEVHNGKE